jgi:hypothetical protein
MKSKALLSEEQEQLKRSIAENERLKQQIRGSKL